MPDCSVTPVDDTSSGCLDSVLHNINYARSLEGLGPLVLPSDYASDSVPVQQLIITDEERGDRGLAEFTGLDPCPLRLRRPLLPPAQTLSHRRRYLYYESAAIFAQDYTPLGADYAWLYNDGYGGTNIDCTSQSDPGCWGHRDNVLGPWSTNTYPDGHDGSRQHRKRAVRRAVRQRAEPAG